MAVQTSYDYYMGESLDGMKADMEAYNTVSKLNKSDAVIPFGTPVFTDGDDGMLPAVSGNTSAGFIGITMRELNRAYTDAQISSGIGAVPGFDATVMTTGVIWVSPLVAVKKNDPVFVDVKSGKITNVAGAEGATIAVPNAKFVSTAAAGKRAKVSLVIGG